MLLLKQHMRVAVEDDRIIKCWCDERFVGGDAHRAHVAEKIREAMMQRSYEVMLDIAQLCVNEAAKHPDCMEFHRQRLEAMAGELDAMYGAVISNKGIVN